MLLVQSPVKVEPNKWLVFVSPTIIKMEPNKGWVFVRQTLVKVKPNKGCLILGQIPIGWNLIRSGCL